jgi:hypothetical protein
MTFSTLGPRLFSQRSYPFLETDGEVRVRMPRMFTYDHPDALRRTDVILSDRTPPVRSKKCVFDKDQDMGGAGGDSHQGVCNLDFQRRTVNFSGKHKIVAIKTLIFFFAFP